MHTVHHEKIYIQCYNCNNLFMHKGQDQVNIVEVLFICDLSVLTFGRVYVLGLSR